MNKLDRHGRPRSDARSKYSTNIDPTSAIFQIFTKIPTPENQNLFLWECLGTGFLISKWGLFLTAWHVVEDKFHLQAGKGLCGAPISKQVAFECPIIDLQKCGEGDIAIGRILAPPELRSKEYGVSTVKVATETSSEGSRVVTYGYPRSVLENEDQDVVTFDLVPDHYDGEILAFHPKGIGLARWPVYEHSVSLGAGISGGPLFDLKSKSAIGVNCSGLGSYSENGKWGTSTDIRLALDTKLSAPITGLEGKTIREILKDENGLT